MKFPQNIDCFHFQAGEKNLLLDIPSMAFMETKNIVSDLLRHTADMTRTQLIDLLTTRYREKEIKEAFEELKLLKENHILLDMDEEKSFSPPGKEPDEGLSCLALTLSTTGNFKYPYGEFNYNNGHSVNMTTATVHKALDFFVENSGPRKYLTVIFCGGEPLLNFETLKYAVLYGDELASSRGKKIDYVIITDGSFFSDSIIEYLNSSEISVQIKLEAGSESQDNLYPHLSASGRNFYDIIASSVKILNSENPRRCKVRSCITSSDFKLTSIVKNFRSLGFNHIYLYPLFTCKNIREEDFLISIEQEYFKLANYYINEYESGNYFAYEGFDNIIKDICSSSRRAYYSGEGRYYMAVDTIGNLYPSHQFLGFKEWCGGNIFDGIDKNIKNTFMDNTVDKVEKCSGCWARYICGGGNYFENYMYNKYINRPFSRHCYLRKLEYKAAFYVISCLEEKDRRYISDRYSPVVVYR